jgi:hypothetical protein
VNIFLFKCSFCSFLSFIVFKQHTDLSHNVFCGKNATVLLSETHVGYETTVDVENFFYYSFCRQKSKNNRYFGGLGILIKKDIRKGIKFVEKKTCLI